MFLFHLEQIANRWFDNWTIYNDPHPFIESSKVNTENSKHIACFQIPYPYDSIIEDQIDEIYDHADHILVLGSELHKRTVKFISDYDYEKITYFLCGYLQGGQVTKAKVYKFLDWFITSTHFYRHIRPDLLFKLNPYEPKPLMFDALLGRKKVHRDTAYHYIHDNGLIEQCSLSYINSYKSNFDCTDINK
jgi:hypothetical protein